MIASVIIPSHNRPESIRRCLDALARQTLEPGTFEVIVVDDGSSPPLSLDPAIWADAFPLTLLRQENTGPAGARDRGVREARAELLAFTDDDCLPTPGWLSGLAAAHTRAPSALLGGSTFNGLPNNMGAETSQIILDLVYEHFNRGEEAYFFASNNIACRRDAYIACGGFDAGFPWAAAEDRDFCDRWRMQKMPMVHVPEARLEHRHGQNLWQFLRMHYRYGRGAHLYQRMRKKRQSGTMREDLGFHATLWPGIRRRLAGRSLSYKLRVGLRLAGWQVANACGFFREAIGRRLAGRRMETKLMESREKAVRAPAPPAEAPSQKTQRR